LNDKFLNFTQRKAQAQMASMVTSTKYLKKIHINYSNSSKNRRGGNTFLFILCDQYFPDIKPQKKNNNHKKSTDLYGYIEKYPQQDTSKSNPESQKTDNIHN
jgi:hypothetical protein